MFGYVVFSSVLKSFLFLIFVLAFNPWWSDRFQSVIRIFVVVETCFVSKCVVSFERSSMNCCEGTILNIFSHHRGVMRVNYYTGLRALGDVSN